MHRTMYHVTTERGTLICWAKSEEEVYNMWLRDHEDPDCRGIMIEQVLTDQGYPIVRLRDLKLGTYFHRVSKDKDCKYCEFSAVWCRGPYDKASKKFECCKYEDVNHTRLFGGDTLVTIDFTF